VVSDELSMVGGGVEGGGEGGSERMAAGVKVGLGQPRRCGGVGGVAAAGYGGTGAGAAAVMEFRKIGQGSRFAASGPLKVDKRNYQRRICDE
jgi:hypothetical protein